MDNPNNTHNFDPKNTPAANTSTQKPKTRTSNWPLGLAIVLIGGVLLARNMGVDLFFLNLHNWWALFILVLAIGPLQQAYVALRREGLGLPVANSLVSAASIIFVALIFLLDLSFFLWWPVFLIMAGLYVMTNR